MPYPNSKNLPRAFNTPTHGLHLLTLLLVAPVIAGCFCSDNPYKDNSHKKVATAPLPDFSQHVKVQTKKAAFFNYIKPLIKIANDKVLHERALILKVHHWHKHNHWIRPVFLDQLIVLANKYRVQAALPSEEFFSTLLTKVDQVPASLALAQAASESGWGTSRFAREGNNLFGQWCFKSGCGLIPNKRGSNKQHKVAQFDTPLASIESYILNLNRHAQYQQFRKARADLRSQKAPLSGLTLVSTLSHYSERREQYTFELKMIIENNELFHLDS